MTIQKQNVFDTMVDWMENGEHSFVTFLSKIVPLIVPVIPAYVGYSHVVNELQFHPFFGWVYGVVIEGLGYSAIFKAVQFWENNRHYTKKENKSPLMIAIVIYIVYLMVTLSVNVLLDLQSGIIWWKVTAIGGISLLSVPAGLLMSISAVHTERLLQREQTRKERKEQRTNSEPENEHRTNKRTPNVRLRTRSDVRSGIRDFVRSIRDNEQRTPGPTEISNALNVSKGYASDVLKEIEQDTNPLTY